MRFPRRLSLRLRYGWLVLLPVIVVAVTVLATSSIQRSAEQRGFDRIQHSQQLLTVWLDRNDALRAFLFTGDRSALATFTRLAVPFEAAVQVERRDVRSVSKARPILTSEVRSAQRWHDLALAAVANVRRHGVRPPPIAIAKRRGDASVAFEGANQRFTTLMETVRGSGIETASNVGIAIVVLAVLILAIASLVASRASRRRDRRLMEGRMVVLAEDMSELRQVERQLRSERDYGATITSSMHEGFMLTRDDTILEVNQALCDLTGFTRAELLGSRVPYPFWAPEAVEDILCHRKLIDEHGHDFEATYVRKSGRRFDASITLVAAHTADGELLGYVSTVRDVSERKRHLAELERLATHDPLTGLANHRVFHERLREEVARASRNFQPLSVAILDFDHFKSINDEHGHMAGDAVLRELGARLSNITREGELIARVGGEEFAWILNAQGPAAFAAAERARRAVAQTPFPYAGAVTVSVGLCDLTVADTADELYAGADQALYRAKGQGRDRTCQSVPGLMIYERS